MAPFTLLGWGLAHVFWTALIAGLFILASLLMWKTAADYSPGISMLLICFVMFGAEFVFATGNTGGLVVGLCTIAAWCLVNERFIPFGILCLVVSLAVKPHDAGFVWLFFLLSGGIHRRRALKVLGIVGVLVLRRLCRFRSSRPTGCTRCAPTCLRFRRPGASVTQHLTHLASETRTELLTSKPSPASSAITRTFITSSAMLFAEPC